MTEILSFPMRTEFPSPDAPQGRMVFVHYRLVNDGTMVELTDEQGRPVEIGGRFRSEIRGGHSAKAVATRLARALRTRLREDDFNRPLGRNGIDPRTIV